jgi:hypothetical protein
MVIAQIGASLIAIALVMRLAAALVPEKPLVTILAGLITATGQPLNTDTAVQTDSIAAALLVAFATIAAHGALERIRLGPKRAVALGLLPAACFLLRENTDLTLLALLPFAAAWIWRAASGVARKAGLAVLILAPLILLNAAQLAWNSSRTGQAFITTGPQVILLQSLMHAQWAGNGVLNRDDPIDTAARRQLAASDHPNGFLAQDELWAVNRTLFEAGWNAVEISRRMKARYLEAWRDHPAGMLHAAWRNLPVELLLLPGSGLRNDPNTTPVPANAADTANSGSSAIFITLSSTTAVVSFAIVLSFLLMPAAALYRRCFKQEALTRVSWFGLGALAAAFGFLALHAIVHFENRFMAPVEPLVILAGLAGITEILPGRRRPDPTPPVRPYSCLG